jgi:hypothetical protein
MTKVTVFLDCTFKALVAVAVMLSIVILAGNPALDTPARPLAASLLALGTLGLLALNRPAVRAISRR